MDAIASATRLLQQQIDYDHHQASTADAFGATGSVLFHARRAEYAQAALDILFRYEAAEQKNKEVGATLDAASPPMPAAAEGGAIADASPCDCVERINRHLAPDQTLNATMAFRGEPQRALVSLIRRDTYKPESRRSKPRFVVATFCPFCGEKYEGAHP